MRIAVRVDGETRVIEFDPGAASVRVGESSYPVRVLTVEGERVEIEVAGEKLVVEGWPPRNARPVGRLSVNGETVADFGLEVKETATAGPAGGPAAPPAPAPAAPVPAAAEGPGTPIRPPMPGKVLEVRVAEGARVAAGQILFVLEAMKMKNEIAAPTAGVVRGLAIAPGISVRAKDVALRLVPE